MAIFRRCDRCAQEHTNHKPKALYVVDGKRQGMLGQIPARVDLCSDCLDELRLWLKNEDDVPFEPCGRGICCMNEGHAGECQC